MVFDLNEYNLLINSVLAAQTNNEKGAAFEELAAYMFNSLDGIEVRHRDARMAAEEIDLVLWNAQIEPIFRRWDDVILVECKNWSSRVGAAVLDAFIAKLRRRSCKTGLFVAANGVTGTFVSGDGNDRGAVSILTSALQEGIRVVVITLEDMRAITTTVELVNLIKERYCGLYVQKVF